MQVVRTRSIPFRLMIKKVKSFIKSQTPGVNILEILATNPLNFSMIELLISSELTVQDNNYIRYYTAKYSITVGTTGLRLF